MSTAAEELRGGDWVQVKDLEEIVRTLDADGTLDGLPFMPEMVQYCGRQFQLGRRARKTCLEYVSHHVTVIGMREFCGDPLWVIDGLRCSGNDHDGCQRGCLIFWKSEWLKKLSTAGPTVSPFVVNTVTPSPTLKTKENPDRYFCQSTELLRVTKPLSLGGRFRICFSEVVSGDVGVLEMLKRIITPIFWKAINTFVKPRYVVGPLEKTPLIRMDLKPGEMVEVKSAEGIRQTLNRKGCNRGLRYDHGLNQFCGTRHRVRDRLDRIIVESTGRMVKIEGTVTFDDTTCGCYMNALGGCTRQDLVYWREAWLKPIEQTGSGGHRA